MKKTHGNVPPGRHTNANRAVRSRRSGRGLTTRLALFAGAITAAVLAPCGAASPDGGRPITVQCPGASCPYTAPSPVEEGAAQDVLARINLERAAPQRRFRYDGQTVALPPLQPAGAAAEQTAQAAAEWEAANGTVADYGGPDPTGFSYLAGENAAEGADSAQVDDLIMKSYGHAGAVLSAAPTEVAVGAACAPGGALYVIEEFFDTGRTTWDAGQAELAAELSENNVYVQSGGTVTTVTDATGTGPAKDYLPQQPIVAGSENPYATGVDWTCRGPRSPAGTTAVSPLPPPVVGEAPVPGGGYILTDSAGAVSPHGSAAFHGGANGLTLAAPVVALAETADGGGYWLVAADGGVFAYGSAPFLGSMGGRHLNAPIVGMAADPDGGGYWLVAADGGVFAYGNAPFLGSMGGRHLNAPIVGMAADPAGDGYWLVASDGGVFSFGNAGFICSMGGRHLNAPIVGVAADPAGDGYWLVASDGGVFAYGNAPFIGSMGGRHLNAPIVGMAADPAGDGYWLVASDGGVFSFGPPFEGAD